MSSHPPSKEILHAFSLSDAPVLLHGGEGTSYRCGDVVLKPYDDAEELNWIAKVYEEITPLGFRTGKPLRATNGSFLVEGWGAWEYVEGKEQPNRWKEKIDVCESFHKALKPVARPSLLNTKMNPWGVADRVVWDEETTKPHPTILPSYERLRSSLRPIKLPSQVIHGDICGNILFADGQDPAVIDFSPYWRPAGFALAVLVVDALVWEGGTPAILKLVSHVPQIDQLLIRAELRRILEIDLHHRMWEKGKLSDIDAHQATIDLLVSE